MVLELFVGVVWFWSFNYLVGVVWFWSFNYLVGVVWFWSFNYLAGVVWFWSFTLLELCGFGALPWWSCVVLEWPAITSLDQSAVDL